MAANALVQARIDEAYEGGSRDRAREHGPHGVRRRAL